jgi:hypothetical protein
VDGFGLWDKERAAGLLVFPVVEKVHGDCFCNFDLTGILSGDWNAGRKSSTRYADKFFQMGSSGVQGVLECLVMEDIASIKS